MSDNDDRRTEIIPPSLPIVYVPAAKYTDKTPAFIPLLTTVLRTGAVMGIDWATLKYIENVPGYRSDCYFFYCCILAVLEYKDWLNFKRRGLYGFSLAFLVVLYASICSYAYVYLRQPPEISPAVIELQSKLAAALRERASQSRTGRCKA